MVDIGVLPRRWISLIIPPDSQVPVPTLPKGDLTSRVLTSVLRVGLWSPDRRRDFDSKEGRSEGEEDEGGRRRHVS